MPLKELTQLKVADLLREYKQSFSDYWEAHDEAVKEFRRKHIEITLEVERTQIISCRNTQSWRDASHISHHFTKNYTAAI